MHIEILYRDEQIVVINKPTGVATHAPQGDLALTDVERALRAQLQLEYLAIHQRLDRDTSGVMLFALDPAANANLATAFAEHTIEKTYQALVYGVPSQSQGVIDAALAPAGDGMIQVAPTMIGVLNQQLLIIGSWPILLISDSACWNSSLKLAELTNCASTANFWAIQLLAIRCMM